MENDNDVMTENVDDRQSGMADINIFLMLKQTFADIRNNDCRTYGYYKINFKMNTFYNKADILKHLTFWLFCHR